MTDYDVEFGKKEGIQDDDFKSYVEAQFHLADDVKEERRRVVEANQDEVWKVQNMVDEADTLVGRSQTYKSPILAALVERLIGSDWIPSISFEPEQPDDVYTARNGTRVHDTMLDKGGFYEEAKKGGWDLFTAGRMFLLKSYKTITKGKKEVPAVVGWKHVSWENVYWTKNYRSWFILDPDFTPDRLVEEFGEEIKDYNIVAGQPFSSKRGEDYDELDWKHGSDDRIGVMYYYNGVRKQFGVIIGGNALILQRFTGDEYPKAWIDQWGKGFVPIDMFDASAILIDDVHPLSTVDRTIDIWRSYSAMMAATIARAKKSASPREVIGSMDPVESRRIWEQGEVDRLSGVDVPHFEKVDAEAGSGLVVKTMDIGVNNANMMTWREAFLEEIMMSETINLRAIYQDSRTLGQDQLRKRAEIQRINDIINLNLANWKRFAETNMLMLVGVNSEFLKQYVGIEDEFTARYDGALADGTVDEVVKDIKEFPFNVSVSVNNSNQAMKEIEIEQKTKALTTLSQIAPQSPAVKKLGKELMRLQYPNILLSDNDFETPQAQPGIDGGAPQMGAVLPGQGGVPAGGADVLG